LDLGGVELAPLGPVPGVVGVDVGVAHEHFEHGGGLHVVSLGLGMDRRDQRVDEHAPEVEGNGITNTAPGATALGSRMYVFAKGVNDKRIYMNSALNGQPFDGWGGGWSEVQW
jgi:hypothetical protein